MTARSLLSSFNRSEASFSSPQPASEINPLNQVATQALAPASSSNSPSLDSRVSLLPTTPTVIITIIANYLSQRELPHLLATNHELRAKVTQGLSHLNLDSPLLNDRNISAVMSQFPQLTSIRLARCPNVAKYGLSTIFPLIDGSRTRPLKRIEIQQMDQVQNADRAWLRFFETLNFTQLQTLSCPEVFAGAESSVYMRLLVTKLTGNQTLQRLEINRAIFSLNRHIAISLIGVLPKTLTMLNFPQIDITDKIADHIMRTFNPDVIQHCNLRFNSGSITKEKMIKLLKFLPLASMKSITLFGNAIDEEAIHYIRSQLKLSRCLETLQLCDLERQLPSTAFELLIQDINSDQLQCLTLNTTITAFLNHLFAHKKMHWPKLKKAYFRETAPTANPRITLSNARSILHTQQALRSRIENGRLNREDTNTELELISLAERLLSTLMQIPIEVILNHYTCLHNTLDLRKQRNVAEFLDALSPRGLGSKHLSQLSKIELISNLEYTIEFEKDRLDRDPNAQEKLLRTIRYASMMQSLTIQEIGPIPEGQADV